MTPLRSLVVDDEAPARKILREYLQPIAEIELVGECADGVEALAMVRRLRPQLLFLDIQMPEMDGFALLEALAPDDVPPRLVFSTAYDAHAVRAFELNAVDYLLKPFDRARFRRTIERLLSPEVTVPDIAALVAAARPPSDTFLVRGTRDIVAVDVRRIRWVEAAGDYCRLHTVDGRVHLTSHWIGVLEAKLGNDRFLRVHRSALVALRGLRRLRADGSGGYVARLDDGTEVRVSRSHAPRLKAWLV